MTRGHTSYVKLRFQNLWMPDAQERLESLGPNGMIYIQVRYLPFVPPEIQAEAMKQLEQERLKANAKTQLRRRATRSTLDMRGVLTVNVHRCINLEARFFPMVDKVARWLAPGMCAPQQAWRRWLAVPFVG